MIAMKRFCKRLWTLVLVLACLIPFQIDARAELPVVSDTAQEGLIVDFSVSPAELVGPGDATMTFILLNQSGTDIRNIYLTSADGLLSEPIGQLAAGESHTLTRPHAVTQEELDEGCVRYIVSHDAPIPGGEKITHTVSAVIHKGDARPDVDFTRQLSSRYLSPGGQLIVTYRVTNNGNVPVTAVKVQDSLGDFTGKLERLEVGGSRTFISRITVNAPVESHAILEYSISPEETVTRELSPVSVQLSDGELNADFSVGRSVFDPYRADAVLVLTNAGNDDYEDITVLDDVYGGVIADSVSLPQNGEPAEIAFTYPVRGGGEYRWRVTGASQSGESLNFTTETLTLEDEPLSNTVDIQLNAYAETPSISRAGNVSFVLELANHGTVAARDLAVYELERGNVRRLAVLPTGDPVRFSISYEVKSDSRFIFCVNYEDAEGHARTISAEPVEVSISPSGVDPDPHSDRETAMRGGSVKLGSSSTFTVLLVVASAALVFMFTILLVTSLRARQDKRRRAQRRKARSDQSARQSRKQGNRPTADQKKK